MERKLTLEQIAKVCRESVEDFAEEHEYIGDPNDLMGYCAIASQLFSDVAAHFGYKVKVVQGNAFDGKSDDTNHCWNEYENMIYDLTATQFIQSNHVHITSIKNRNYKKFLEGTSRMKRNFSTNWPEEQSPTRQYKKIKPYIYESIDLINKRA